MTNSVQILLTPVPGWDAANNCWHHPGEDAQVYEVDLHPDYLVMTAVVSRARQTVLFRSMRADSILLKCPGQIVQWAFPTGEQFGMTVPQRENT